MKKEDALEAMCVAVTKISMQEKMVKLPYTSKEKQKLIRGTIIETSWLFASVLKNQEKLKRASERNGRFTPTYISMQIPIKLGLKLLFLVYYNCYKFKRALLLCLFSNNSGQAGLKSATH